MLKFADNLCSCRWLNENHQNRPNVSISFTRETVVHEAVSMSRWIIPRAKIRCGSRGLTVVRTVDGKYVPPERTIDMVKTLIRFDEAKIIFFLTEIDYPYGSTDFSWMNEYSTVGKPNLPQMFHLNSGVILLRRRFKAPFNFPISCSAVLRVYMIFSHAVWENNNVFEAMYKTKKHRNPTSIP